MQMEILKSKSLINIVYAPTGAGKSYAFRKAMMNGERVLFVVPTKQLGKNQHASIISDLTSEELANREGRKVWTSELAHRKVQNWNSESKEHIIAKGYKSVLTYYHQKLNSLDFRDGGEIIFCTPETLSNIFMSCNPSGARADSGLISAVNWFDKIVYDEFHTIQERGFGIITTIASCAKAWAMEDGGERKSSIFLLSATPVDVSETLNDMGFDTSDESEVRRINEELTSNTGRVLHGDVELEIHDSVTPSEYLSENKFSDISRQNKLVVIYDSVKRLKQEINEVLNVADVDEGDVGNINGLDSQIESKSSGRDVNIDERSLIIGTSSIEMGVTIKDANYLITEPGFTPLSLMQRIGRVARGDVSGKVIIVCKDVTGRPWIGELVKHLNELGSVIHINDFAHVFSKVSRVNKKMKIKNEAQESFGSLGKRASFCCVLYHYILAKKLYQSGSVKYAKRVTGAYEGNKCYSLIIGLMNSFNRSINDKEWLSYFLSSAEALRDFSPTIKIVCGGKSWSYSEFWIRKNTDIMAKNPIQIDDNGNPYIEVLEAEFSPEVLNKSNRVKDVRTLIMPDCSRRKFLSKSAMTDYVNACKSTQANRIEEEKYKASVKLVELTGILPFGEDENEAPAQAMLTVI